MNVCVPIIVFQMTFSPVKKWSDKGIRQWDFKDISLKMWGIRGHSEKKKGWSTLSPKLFLELLLPGLQKTQLKPIYSYDPSWGEDGGKRAVRFRDRADKHGEQSCSANQKVSESSSAVRPCIYRMLARLKRPIASFFGHFFQQTMAPVAYKVKKHES